MYHCSPKYDLNMSFENEIYIPEVGLGHSSKDRCVEYIGKNKTTGSYDKEPVLSWARWRASERGKDPVGMGVWFLNCCLHFPFFIVWLSHFSVIPSFASKSPVYFFDFLYFDFLLWCHSAHCADFRRPPSLSTKSVTSCLTFQICHTASISKSIPIFLFVTAISFLYSGLSPATNLHKSLIKGS